MLKLLAKLTFSVVLSIVIIGVFLILWTTMAVLIQPVKYIIDLITRN